MEIFEIEWIPFTASKHKWWVYNYPCDEAGLKLQGENIPTARVIGQYESLEEALVAHPTAILSENSKSMMEKNKG